MNDEEYSLSHHAASIEGALLLLNRPDELAPSVLEFMRNKLDHWLNDYAFDNKHARPL